MARCEGHDGASTYTSNANIAGRWFERRGKLRLQESMFILGDRSPVVSYAFANESRPNSGSVCLRFGGCYSPSTITVDVKEACLATSKSRGCSCVRRTVSPKLPSPVGHSASNGSYHIPASRFLTVVPAGTELRSAISQPTDAADLDLAVGLNCLS